MFHLKSLFAALSVLSLVSASPVPEAAAGPQQTQAPQPYKRATFTHPGVLNSKAQLDFVKGQVAGE